VEGVVHAPRDPPRLRLFGDFVPGLDPVADRHRESRSIDDGDERLSCVRQAWTEGDFGAAGGLLCAGVAAPQLLDAGSGTPVTFRPTGGASRGPDPSAAVDTSHPHIDYHVPVHGQQGGTTVRGSVEVTLDRSDTSPCIRAYTMVIDAS